MYIFARTFQCVIQRVSVNCRSQVELANVEDSGDGFQSLLFLGSSASHILFYLTFKTEVRPFQDYFSSCETGQSVGGTRNLEKKHLPHPQAELGLSHMHHVWGSKLTPDTAVVMAGVAAIRLRSHRNIRYTVYGIRYTLFNISYTLYGHGGSLRSSTFCQCALFVSMKKVANSVFYIFMRITGTAVHIEVARAVSVLFS